MATSAICKTVAHDLRVDLDELLLEAGQRSILDRSGRRQGAQEGAEIISECVLSEPHRVSGKHPTRQRCPPDRAFTFLDPPLARPTLDVEGNDALGGAALVRHDEADARIEFSVMPLDLRNHLAQLGPASHLIGKIGVELSELVRRPRDRALEQIANPVLDDLVVWNADRMLDALGFQILVNTRHGEGRIGPEIDARDLATHDDQLERTVPAIGAVHVARSSLLRSRSSKVVEYK
jgi:hypothetical protein